MESIDDQPASAAPATSRIAALAALLDPSEPRAVRGPFRRWPRATDGVLAVVVLAASVVSVAVSELPDGDRFTAASIGDLSPGAFVLLAVLAGALWWRRAQSATVTASVLAVMMMWALLDYGDGHDLPLVVAVYSVGRYCTDHRHSLAALVAAVSGSIIGTLIDAHQQIDVWPTVFFVGLPWYVGRRVRNRGDYLALLRERADRLEAEQHARAIEAVAAERSRIARELHDVVAHRVSMMTVQAGAAKTIAGDDLDAAIEAMGDVERAGRDALGELRHLLGVLRRGGVADRESGDDLGPQPGLDAIPALVDDLERTGADINFTFADIPRRINTAIDLSAYRIVQESFTNILKHAGPNPTVDVTIAFEPDTLVIDVTSTTRTATAADRPRSGYGIAGMTERATLLGGILTAGPQPPNHFRVNARLPLELEPT